MEFQNNTIKIIW